MSLPKIDNPIDVTKYKPIWVLCILSKVFEDVILTQLCNYIEVKVSYNLTQSGFCTRINRIMKNKLPYCNIRFVFQTKCKISNFFTFKDKIPSFLRSGIVYKFQCGSCNATYYGKTKRHFKVRMCEHLGISALTGKRVKGDDDSAIKEHLLFCNHTPEFEDFSILASNNNDFKVTLMESLLINRDHPPLNKNKQSLPLELFDS